MDIKKNNKRLYNEINRKLDKILSENVYETSELLHLISLQNKYIYNIHKEIDSTKLEILAQLQQIDLLTRLIHDLSDSKISLSFE